MDRGAGRDAARAPLWIRRPGLLERGAVALNSLILTGGVLVLALQDHALTALVALAVSGAGVLTLTRRPVTALLLVAAAPLIAGGLGVDPLALWQVATFTGFLLAFRGLPGGPTAVVVGASSAAAVALSIGSTSADWSTAAIAGVTGVAFATAGSSLRGQREYWAELQERTDEAVAGRDDAVARSIAEERLRIARDLHDSVGHQIAVLSMHLGAAEVHLSPGEHPARDHLSAARGGVKSLLTETQAILQVLRAGGVQDSSPPASHRDIPVLVEAFTAAGMRIDAHLVDVPPELPAQVSAAAYRIAQEALTNAQRYGDGSVSLAVTGTGCALTLQAQNGIARGGAEPDREGKGLIGMRERAIAAGGVLEVDSDGRTFRLRAVLPLGEAAMS